MHVFAWDEWNTEHIAKHGVSKEEAEYVVRHAQAPFPREHGDEKYLVWGQTEDGRYLQVVFAYRSDDEVEYESLDLEDVLALADDDAVVIYVVHAMDLTERMKRQFRKLRKTK